MKGFRSVKASSSLLAVIKAYGEIRLDERYILRRSSLHNEIVLERWQFGYTYRHEQARFALNTYGIVDAFKKMHEWADAPVVK